jgi:DNA-binding MarR family transcriptional regulator
MLTIFKSFVYFLVKMDDLVIINWLHDGAYRIKVMQILNSSPDFPNKISKSLNIHKSSLSRILNDLHNKGLIERITSSSRTITYKITELGKIILKKVEKNGIK